MKTLFLTMLSVAWTCPTLSAASLMINLRSSSANAAASGDVSAPYLTLSPGHDDGAIAPGETTWNNFSAASPASSLWFGDGNAAIGATLTFGNESSAGSGIIDFATVAGINSSSLYGTGGGSPGRQVLVGNPSSIYGSGNNSSNSAAGRAGWFGGGTASAGYAIGMRLDGLAPGDYRIYVMARNTNTNATTAAPMNVHAATGTLSSTFDFSSLSSIAQSNTTYPNTNPEAYNAFVAGENYVAFDLTVTAGESLFLASDGGSAGETRGFLNMIQIVSVPEPSAGLMGLAGLLPLCRRRR